MKNLTSAETGLAGTLSRLMMVSEAYPDLKANQNMMQLTEELTSTENKISFARQAYNDSVMTYNTDREVFPTNFIAGAFNFAPAELFAIEKPEEKEAPKVSFS
jgi:LemA protein